MPIMPFKMSPFSIIGQVHEISVLIAFSQKRLKTPVLVYPAGLESLTMFLYGRGDVIAWTLSIFMSIQRHRHH